MNKSERIIFFGTPDFAVPSLQALAAQYDVVAVVTQPDKPVGRKQVLTASPIKQLAQALQIPVLQPTTLKPHRPSGATFLQTIADLKPTLGMVIAYGKILPQSLLDLFPRGCLNIHGSVLPTLRGPSPIQTAILEGLPNSGVTIMLLDQGMDTGPILTTAPTPLSPTETSASLHDTLKELGAQLLLTTLPDYLSGKIVPQPQDDAMATLCRLIEKTDGLIDWSQSDEAIDRHVRALNPWPGTYTIVDGKRLKILASHLSNHHLIIDLVQLEGKSRLSYDNFRRGHPALRIPTSCCCQLMR